MTTEMNTDQNLQQAEVHFTGQSPLQQAEAYFTECVIIASETPNDLDRDLKFEQAKMTAIKLLNYNIVIIMKMHLMLLLQNHILNH